MKAKYLFTGLAATSLIVASCNDKSSTATTDSATTESAESVDSAENASTDTPKTAPDLTPAPPAEPETTIAKELDGKARIMVNGEYQETQIKNADYYIVYFTASWWPPCRASVSKLVGTYNDVIAPNDKVELILMSADRSAAKAKSWSAKHSFPWPQVLPEFKSGKYSFMKHRNRYVPQYILVDSDGNLVAEKLPAILEKIKTL